VSSDADLWSIAADLETSIDEAPLVGDALEVGTLCAALYSEDELWYRSRVTELDRDGGNAVVLFIDYGNSDTVAIDSLRCLLTEPLLNLDPQAIRYW